MRNKTRKGRKKRRFYEVIISHFGIIQKKLQRSAFWRWKKRKSRETLSFAQTAKMRPKSESSIAVTSATTISNQLVVASTSSGTKPSAHVHDSLSLFPPNGRWRSEMPFTYFPLDASLGHRLTQQWNDVEHLCSSRSNPNLNLPLEIFCLSVQL